MLVIQDKERSSVVYKTSEEDEILHLSSEDNNIVERYDKCLVLK